MLAITGRIFQLLPPITPTFGAQQTCPIDRQVMKDGAIVAIAKLGGLHIAMNVLRREMKPDGLLTNDRLNQDLVSQIRDCLQSAG